MVWHPLEEMTETGIVKFYLDAEAVLERLPRRGVPLILRGTSGSTSEPYTPKYMAKLVRKLRNAFGLTATFTLDACRHGSGSQCRYRQARVRFKVPLTGQVLPRHAWCLRRV